MWRILGCASFAPVPPPVNMRFLADSAGQTVIEIYNPKASIPDYRQFDPLHIHIAFTTDDVAGIRQRLLAVGAAAEGEVSHLDNGDVLAMLRDPWGIPVQLVHRAQPLL
jgi:hypothetical protein